MSTDPLAPRLTPSELAAIQELDLVTLAVPVRSDDGETVPAGLTGTVVAIWHSGAAYEVEFTEPIEALATVMPSEIGSHEPYGDRSDVGSNVAYTLTTKDRGRPNS